MKHPAARTAMVVLLSTMAGCGTNSGRALPAPSTSRPATTAGPPSAPPPLVVAGAVLTVEVVPQSFGWRTGSSTQCGDRPLRPTNAEPIRAASDRVPTLQWPGSIDTVVVRPAGDLSAITTRGLTLPAALPPGSYDVYVSCRIGENDATFVFRLETSGA